VEEGYDRPVDQVFVHEPVLASEAVDLLAVREGGTYIDGTLGSGGHAVRIVERIGTRGCLLGIDRDEAALSRARQRLAGWRGDFLSVHGNFSDMAEIARAKGMDQVDGILLDLGVSLDQFEASERGFSFMREGPLDMRMDRTGATTAADIVNKRSQDELESIIRILGEDRDARRIARALVAEREKAHVTTTLRLAEIVARAKGGARGRINPATKTFQALRIAVNDELGAVEKGLEAGLGLLRPGGRMAVISFHSLEDRLVKTCFKAHAGSYESLEGGGRLRRFTAPAVMLVTKKPVTASPEELEHNSRARSAKLRVAERIMESDRK